MSRACTKCGSRRLVVGEDKNKPVGYAFTNPIYAKRYTCKDCGHAWTEGEEEKEAQAQEYI